MCGATSTVVLARPRGGDLRRCSSCGHAFLVAERAAAEAVYNDHYAGFRDDPVFEREARCVLTEELLPRARPPARLLDVGCGNGAFLELARDAGYDVVGIDVADAAIARGRARGFDVRAGDLREPGCLGTARFDVITFWDVVEHLPDPRSFLQRAYELLNPDGHVLIKTPRTSAATVRVSAVVPRSAGALLQAPSHVQYFARAGIEALLRATGFDRVSWLPSRPMRSQQRGGSVRRRVARTLVRTFQRIAGDGNLLVIAQRR